MKGASLNYYRKFPFPCNYRHFPFPMRKEQNSRISVPRFLTSDAIGESSDFLITDYFIKLRFHVAFLDMKCPSLLFCYDVCFTLNRLQQSYQEEL